MTIWTIKDLVCNLCHITKKSAWSNTSFTIYLVKLPTTQLTKIFLYVKVCHVPDNPSGIMFLQKNIYQNNSNSICFFLSISTSVTFSIFSILILFHTTTLFYISFISFKTILYPSIHLFHHKANWLYINRIVIFTVYRSTTAMQRSTMIFSCSIKHYFLLKHSKEMYCIFNMIIVKFLFRTNINYWTIISN
jgi:hypothetical protein